MLLNIRSKEIYQWRKMARSMAETLANMEATARENDTIVLALHEVALILIAHPPDWQKKIERLLCRRFKLSACELLHLTPLPAEIEKLPLRGKVNTVPLAHSKLPKKYKTYFHIPLYKQKPQQTKQKKKIGVLTFASQTEDAFPADAARDFSQRLSELISTAL